MREIFDKQVTITIIAYTLVALHSVSFDQILPVFLDFPRQIPNDENTHLPFHFSGGFGMNSSEIGMIFTVYGVACGIIQIFCFPPICNRYGALNCFRAGSKSCSLYPIPDTQPRRNTDLFSSRPLPNNLHHPPLHRAHPIPNPAIRSPPHHPPRQRRGRHRRLSLHHHPPHQLRALAPHPRHPQRLRDDLLGHRPRGGALDGRRRVFVGRQARLHDPRVLAAEPHLHGPDNSGVDDRRGGGHLAGRGLSLGGRGAAGRR